MGEHFSIITRSLRVKMYDIFHICIEFVWLYLRDFIVIYSIYIYIIYYIHNILFILYSIYKVLLMIFDDISWSLMILILFAVFCSCLRRSRFWGNQTMTIFHQLHNPNERTEGPITSNQCHWRRPRMARVWPFIDTREIGASGLTYHWGQAPIFRTNFGFGWKNHGCFFLNFSL